VLRRHVEANLDRIAALEHVTGFAVWTADRDVGDLDLARAPATFIGLETVLRSLRFLGSRTFTRLDRGLDGCDVLCRCGSYVRRDVLGRSSDTRGLRFRELVLFRVFNVDDVGSNDALRIAFAFRDAVIEPVRDVAELLDQVERVRDE